MIEEIEKRLADGEIVELECVDREGFLKDIRRRGPNEKILDQAHLLVDYIDYDGGIRLGGNIGDIYCNVIVSGEFKYFRIKESSTTFDDLIDVALTALKDRVLSGVELERDGVESLRYWADKRSDCNVIFSQHSSYQDGIDFIKSLYTETFVIEGSSCILKINENIQSLVLANGCDIVDRVYFEGGSMRLRDCFGNSISLTNLNILKGATVTQKRGK